MDTRALSMALLLGVTASGCVANLPELREPTPRAVRTEDLPIPVTVRGRTYGAASLEISGVRRRAIHAQGLDNVTVIHWTANSSVVRKLTGDVAGVPLDVAALLLVFDGQLELTRNNDPTAALVFVREAEGMSIALFVSNGRELVPLNDWHVHVNGIVSLDAAANAGFHALFMATRERRKSITLAMVRDPYEGSELLRFVDDAPVREQLKTSPWAPVQYTGAKVPL